MGLKRWLLLFVPLLAWADVRIDVEVSFDDTISSTYRAGNKPEPDPNSAPVWVTTPNPSGTEGESSNYSLLTNCTDVNGDTLTFTWNSGSAARPTGVDISGSNITDAGSASAGTTTGLIVDCDDGVADPVASSAFSYTVVDPDALAFTEMTPTNTIAPEIASWGTDWSTFLATDPDYEVRYITNLNTSGAGSFDAAVSNCSADTIRFVIPEVSGAIDYSKNTGKVVTCSGLVYVGSYAPSPGLHVFNYRLTLRGQNQFWLHYSCFNDSDGSQGNGHCMDVQDSATRQNSRVVVMNYGGAFAYDGAYQITSGSTLSSLIHGLSVYPTVQGPTLRQISLLGDTGANISTKIGFIRNVGTHHWQRCPWAVSTDDLLVANNVCFSGGASYTVVTKITTASHNANVIGNLYVYANESSKSIKPIRFGTTSSDPQTTAANIVYLSGNRTFDGPADTTQSNLVQDHTGGLSSIAGSVTGAIPQGFVATTISTTAADKRAKAALICLHAGPRPNDRLAIYQQACDEIDATFAGSGSQGARIDDTADHNLGYPTVAENSCDATDADDCGTGVPAFPEGGMEGAGSHINAAWTAAWASHCARMEAGAPGC